MRVAGHCLRSLSAAPCRRYPGGLKTLLQTFVAVLIAQVGAAQVGVSAGLFDVDWLNALSVAVLAAILSVATSVGNGKFTAGADPVTVIGDSPNYQPADADEAGKHAAA